MKKYNVTVNGVVYEVMVEEVSGDSVNSAASEQKVPVKEAKPAPQPKTPSTEGGIKVCAPMPGTILKMNVKVGDVIKANDLVCILEAMKMENEIFASEGGTVKAINAPQGSSVNSGDVIITLG